MRMRARVLVMTGSLCGARGMIMDYGLLGLCRVYLWALDKKNYFGAPALKVLED